MKGRGRREGPVKSVKLKARKVASTLYSAMCSVCSQLLFDVCVCIRGVAGEPAEIKCTLNGSCKVRLGQKVDGDIDVSVRDKHGNEIKKVRPPSYYYCFCM